ncbi:MAG: peptidase C13 [Halioglobus sp.]|nr:peptidase C13 [Halioglobus sp.]
MIATTLRRIVFALACLAMGFGLAFFLLMRGCIAQPVKVAELVDGGRYVGDVVDGRLEGAGFIEWPGGSRYAGDFRDGRLHGDGLYEDSFGTRYEGQFRDGQLAGKASIHYGDGSHYEGEAQAWLMHGEGTYVTGDDEYRGTFVDGKLTGKGEHLHQGELVYRGDFKDWQYHGRGKRLSGDEFWRGEFVDGYLVSGVHRSGKSGARYRGDFSFERYHGEGRLERANGDHYEGGFHFGDFHGLGTMKLAAPREGITEYSGTWRNGRLMQSEVSAFVENYKPDVEKALYGETALLEEELLTLVPGDPDTPEVYFLGIAGDGTQRVFSREVSAFRDHLDRLSSLQERQIALLNDRILMGKQPMATRTSIARALAMLGERMNTEDDVLVLYITSHGSDNHEISLRNAHLELEGLPADVLAEMLLDSGIRWRVIFVSACYSGGFIDALADDESLIMTAAAADRTSFGCSDQAETTYFGRALLDSLSRSADPAQVYSLLREAIAEREAKEALSPSEPQFFLGPKMAEKLARHGIGVFRPSDPP